jgi:hypothetical protein
MTDLLLPALKTDPASDTLRVEASVETPSPATTDWHVATFADLRQVEDMLDWLESRGIAEREVHSLAGNAFAVRWR